MSVSRSQQDAFAASAASSSASIPRQPRPPAKKSHNMSAASRVSRSLSFESLLGLINDPATSDQYDRHLVEIRTIEEKVIGKPENTSPAAPNAVIGGLTPSCALDGAPQVVAFLVSKLNDETVKEESCKVYIIPALTTMLELCSLPIVCTTLDDQRRHEPALAGILLAVSGALGIERFPETRITTANVLRQVFSHIRDECADDINPPPPTVSHKRKQHQRCVSEGVIGALLDTWARAVRQDHQQRHVDATVSEKAVVSSDHDEDDEHEEANCAASMTSATPEVVALLKAVLELSYYKEISQMMCEKEACDLIFATLATCSPGDRRLTLCIDTLWNLLSLCGHECALLVAEEAKMNILKGVLTEVLAVGYKQKERELRNDIIIILSLIASSDEQSTAIPQFDHMVSLLLDLSCGAERHRATDVINPKFHYTTNCEDQQLKILTWCLLEKLCTENEEFASAIFEYGFAEVLLSYVDVRCEDPSVVRWSTIQLLDLQRTALFILSSLAVQGSEFLSAASAPHILVEYISECPDISLRDLAVNTLGRLATTRVRSELVEVGIVPLSLNLLQDQQCQHALRVECLNILADTVDRDEDLQRTFLECDGAHVVLPLLSFDPPEYTDLVDAVIFSAVDCVWSCIVGSDENEKAFLLIDGVHALLSVVERCPEWYKHFPLSCLADILQNQSATEEFLEWRSAKTGKSGTQLLLSLWKTLPLNSTLPRRGLAMLGTSVPANLDAANKTKDDESADIFSIQRHGLDEVPQDIRALVEANKVNAKVYSCLSAVGFEDHKELDPLEKGALAAVSSFVDLCRDEIWGEVEQSLVRLGVDPISSDAMKLQKLRSAADARAAELMNVQEQCAADQEVRDRETEMTFFRTLIKKTDEKPAEHVNTKKNIGLSITEAKIRKAQMLKESFKQALDRQHAVVTADNETDDEDEAVAELQQRQKQEAEERKIEEERRALAEKEKASRWGLGQRAMSDAEFKILQALNKARTDPKSLIPLLEKRCECVNEEGTAIFLPGAAEPEICVEGKGAINEAIQFLSTVRPLVTLLDVPMGILLGARDHVNDLSTRMEITTDGYDNATPQQRIAKYGKPSAKNAQLISIGCRDPLDTVIQLIIDDGVQSRVDRRNLFDPDIRVCGVSEGPHPIHSHVVVIVLAYEYTDFDYERQKSIHDKSTVALANARGIDRKALPNGELEKK